MVCFPLSIFSTVRLPGMNVHIKIAGAQGNDVKKAWATAFPAIELDFTVDLSKYHDSRIDRAYWAKNETVDVAILQTLHDFQRWKKEDRLMFYKPPTFEDLYSGEKDLDGAFLP